MATAVERAQAILGNTANVDQSNINIDTAKNIANAAWAVYTKNRDTLPNGDPLPESPSWEQKATVLINLTRSYYQGLLTVETGNTYTEGKQAVIDAALADPTADIGSEESIS